MSKSSEIAQQLAAAPARGDLLSAVEQLPARGLLPQSALPARPADVDVIREMLRLDRILSAAIRERMIAISTEAKEGRAARAASPERLRPRTAATVAEV